MSGFGVFFFLSRSLSLSLSLSHSCHLPSAECVALHTDPHFTIIGDLTFVKDGLGFQMCFQVQTKRLDGGKTRGPSDHCSRYDEKHLVDAAKLNVEGVI